jgi:hypothetical protein
MMKKENITLVVITNAAGILVSFLVVFSHERIPNMLPVAFLGKLMI